MSDHPVRLVCFDLGGVLLRICRTWDEGCRAAGIEPRPGANDPVLVERRRAVSHAYSLGRIDCDACFRGMSEATSGLYTPDEVARVHDAWLVGEYPGVGPLIDRLLNAPHVRTGVLSNTNHRHWVRIAPGPRAEFPAAARLPNLHASHILGLAKPDPAIYAAFERSVGVRGPEILFFDDLDENIAAAKAAGWQAVQVDHQGDTATQMLRHLSSCGAFSPHSMP
jgi:glucose-1-phosphatase